SQDIVGTATFPIDPQFDPSGLQFNDGGATATIALFPGSPAVDKGITNSLTTDQRGTGYLRRIDSPAVTNAVGGDGADIGALEVGARFDAVSRKTHGNLMFDIPLPLAATTGVECRTGGAENAHQLVLTFPSAISLTNARVTSGTGSASALASGSQLTVDLTGIANAQTIMITLFGVSDGTSANNIRVPLSALLGDTNADRAVNSGDAQQTRNRSGQTAAPSNFRSDVNADGSINSGDAFIVRSRSGTSLP
ncbi:MAG TPA: choice-of-anchor Q domain-containing protein, partial [Chthoniobacterales bacterium]